MVDSPDSQGIPWRWGDPRFRYPEEGRRRVLAYLSRHLGAGPSPPEEAGLAPRNLPAPRLSGEDFELLKGLVTRGAIQSDDRSRLTASAGGSYLDLVRLRTASVPDVADAVVEPDSLEELQAVVRWADIERVALVPRSGGTSVVGGLDPLRDGHRAVIVVSDRRFSRPGVIQLEKRIATFGAGTLGPELEAQLRRSGLTLGHFPQSFERSALGGWIAARSFGQASTRYGTPTDRLEGFTIVTPHGTFHWERSHRPVESPDPGSVVPGSEGTLGVLVEATLRVEPLPEMTRWFSALYPSWSDGVEAMRRLASASPVPAVARMSDGEETDLTLAESGWEAGGGREWLRRLVAAALGYRTTGLRSSCLLIVSFEGNAAEVRLGGRNFRSERRGHRAAWLPAMVGRAWERSRFRTPYLRDDLVESGWFVETFETFVSWSTVPTVKKAAEEAVRAWAAARGVSAYVGAHLSHPTADGTALYFTVIAPQKHGEEEAAWQAFKQATAEAVVAAGGTVSHHHGVGRYHRPWVARSLPASRLEGLKVLKARWDPNGIMNPGKTLPEP